MPSKALQLAQDVTTLLNATSNSWYGQFSAATSIVPRVEQEKLTGIECQVSPTNIAGGELVNRAGQTQDDYVVYVALLKRMENVETEGASMMEKLETVRDWLKANRTVGSHKIIGEIPTAPLMSVEHARNKSLYLGVLALTIRVIG
jgi:hypothetical protein